LVVTVQSNDSKLSSNDLNGEPLPLGKRFPHLKSVFNTAKPEDYEHSLKLFGCEYCNYKKECEFCGEIFYSKSSKRKYCSYRCGNDAWIIRRREYNKQKRNKVCLFCKTSFTAKSRKAIFCCSAHRVAFFRQQKKRNDSKLVSNETNLQPLQQKEAS
jgi:hypothetical protein